MNFINSLKKIFNYPCLQYGWQEMLQLHQQHQFSTAAAHHLTTPSHQSPNHLSPPLLQPGIRNLGLNLPLMMLGATETLHQNAAQLLLLNIQWTKTVPAFQSLPFRDQLVLLEESWRELFLLAASQFNLPLELGPKLLNNYDSDSDSIGNNSFIETLHYKPVQNAG